MLPNFKALTKTTILAVFAVSTLALGFAGAQDAISTEDFMSRSNSCRAEAIDRYYCPWFGGGFQGPYFDNGCSVKCAAGQKAVCKQATCADDQNGQPVESSCVCK